ncbi:hypothetical protein FFK22_034020 [Mycobacterium sp. KBS0706]|uniref:hypothetical protein n=1 Tax=Mycobacterium sp. KBS0706 TaxID=2578109 RepID=UPI00110FE5F7|nr:hypothetical protein [Mycobacterium sp. KBS0706]TSD84178.1 hypothetical protein FFK22_034020 [Mycobacterium sp. KBS0706]
MKESPDSDLDVHAHCRSLALQQIGMLTRIAEIGMRLVEAEGAKAIAQAERPDADQPRAKARGADAPAARDHGVAFTRHAGTVQRALALRARAAADLCARDKAQAPDREAARKARRDRHREQVRERLHDMIWDETEDLDRVDALHAELDERIRHLYEDEDVRVEDRPVGSVMAGLACGLGFGEAWRSRWAHGQPATPRPARPAGSEARIEAERAKRRDAAIAAVERACAKIDDPSRMPGIRAGLAVRLQEADVIEWLDTETIFTVTDRLCRSLGIDSFLCLESLCDHNPDEPDTG